MEVFIAVIISLMVGGAAGVYLTLALGPQAIKSDMEQLRLMYSDWQARERQLRQEQQILANMKQHLEVLQPPFIAKKATSPKRSKKS